MDSASTIAKKLRKRQTEAEKRLWRHLKAKQLEGVKFRRQEPIGKYIVDFASFDRKLVIELDGGQHADDMRDAGRDAWLGTQGFEVLRFWNNEIFENFDGVLEEIRRRVVSHPPVFPASSPLAGEDLPHISSPPVGEDRGEGEEFHPPLAPPIKGGGHGRSAGRDKAR